MNRLKGNSDKYGKCEVCHTYCDSVYIKKIGLRKYIFGHQKCLNEYKKTSK